MVSPVVSHLLKNDSPMKTRQARLPYTAEDAYVDWAFLTLIAAAGDPVGEEARFRVAVLEQRAEIQALAIMCRRTLIWRVGGEGSRASFLEAFRASSPDAPWMAGFRSLAITLGKVYRAELPLNTAHMAVRMTMPVIAELLSPPPGAPAPDPAGIGANATHVILGDTTQKQLVGEFAALMTSLSRDTADPGAIPAAILANREAVLDLARRCRALWPWHTAGAVIAPAMKARFTAAMPEAPWVAGLLSICDMLDMADRGMATADNAMYAVLITLPVIGELLDEGTEVAPGRPERVRLH